MRRILALCLAAALALTGFCESTIAILPSQYHVNEFDGALTELGVGVEKLSYDQFREGCAFQSADRWSVVAVPPLFNYRGEIKALSTNAAAVVFGRFREWLKAGGVLFMPDANYDSPMVNDWLRLIDPVLVMPKNKVACNCAAPPALTEDGKAFGPEEVTPGLSWAHLSLGEPTAWIVLSRCGHGEPVTAMRRYGKGLIFFTCLRQEYEAYFRNLLFWHFRERNGREPSAADGTAFVLRPRLPQLPEVKASVTSGESRTEITLDESNLTAMTSVDLIAGVQRLVNGLCAATRDKATVLNAFSPTNAVSAARARIVNREIARFADGRRVLWCGPGVLGEDRKSRSRILSEGFGGYNWWLERLIRNRREILASGGKIDLVLLGDSITHNWEKDGAKQLKELRRAFSVLSAGYSGDTVPTLRWRVENGELDGFEAKTVMMLIGTNDAQWRMDRTPRDIAGEIRDLVKIIRRKQPRAKIILSSVFPRGETPDDPLRLRVNEINRELEGVDKQLKITFTRFADSFVSADGTISKSLMGDFLHPGESGYRTWLEAVRPYFNEKQ